MLQQGTYQKLKLRWTVKRDTVHHAVLAFAVVAGKRY